MDIRLMKQHAATIEAAEEFVIWLKQADDYSDVDLAEALRDITAAAGLHKFGLAMLGVAYGNFEVVMVLNEVPPFELPTAGG